MRWLTYQQRLFVEFYRHQESKSPGDAARRAGYRYPEKQGPRLVKQPAIQAAIDAGEATAAMASSEVLARVSEVASADLLDFWDITESGEATVNLASVNRLGLGHLIKKVRTRKDGRPDIELEPKLPALIRLGEHYKLWKGDAQPQLTLCDLAKSLKEKYERLRREDSDKADGMSSESDEAVS